MLQILKASAGSGKTFRLTFEYIKLLFRAKTGQNRRGNAHRRILAVTFTNKATDEMKSRILQELSRLANGEKSPYRRGLCEEFNANEASVNELAQEILTEILHDYSYFSITTIDRFFQQIIRSFTREIGLSGGYSVELDEKRITAIAVDNMLADLDKKENKQLLEWLTRFSEDKIEQGENWDFRRNITLLSGQLSKEEYRLMRKDMGEKLENKNFLAQYQTKMYGICRKFENDLQTTAKQALSIINTCGLDVSDFKGGSVSAMKYWHKILDNTFTEPTQTFVSWQNDLSLWATKTASPAIKSQIEQAYNSGLNSCIVEVCEMFEREFRRYKTAKEIIRNFYTLGILSDIERQVKACLNEQNRILLSDSTQLLNMIIDGSDTPFVYEKIGSVIANFMIDEFQDTSQMQWQNFHPLIDNSLSRGNENLIVGDVKQSIYRFRNSDWKLLDSLLDEDFRPELLRHETLSENWRSDKQIVEFNNAFFAFAAKTLQQQLNEEAEANRTGFAQPAIDRALSEAETFFDNKILHAYSDVHQQLSPNREEGRVQIEFLEDDDERSWKDLALEKLVGHIERLQEQHYRLSDMAILVRTKQEGKDIADFLLQYKQSEKVRRDCRYDIISDEALTIAAAASVKFLIGILRWIENPTDLINQSVTAFEYGKLLKKQSQEEALKQLFNNVETGHTPSLQRLWKMHSKQSVEEIKNQSLFEMLEQIIALFHLGEDENERVFVQAFQDIVYDFMNQNIAGTQSFLRWWDDIGSQRTLSIPDSQDAIRILTIHKSKGLGFNVLLMPFCDFGIDQKKDYILWCKAKTAPFNELDIVPVSYSASRNTLFVEEYLNEKQYSYIDNLNLIYVAFTRAKNELIACCPKPKKEGTINSVATLLYAFAPPSPPERGDVLTPDLREKSCTSSSPPSEGLGEASIPPYLSSQNKQHLKLKLRSDGFGEENTRYAQLNYGILMHELLNAIHYESDLPLALQTMQQEGKINEEEKERMAEKILSLWENPTIKNWFSTDYRIMNESVIITPQSSSYRPDRVIFNDRETIVIDYKFGQKERNSYLKQVENYVRLIETMGFPNVSGYICYAEEGYSVSVA